MPRKASEGQAAAAEYLLREHGGIACDCPLDWFAAAVAEAVVEAAEPIGQVPERTLEEAVRDYLTEFYWDDEDGTRISWPLELEKMTGWTAPTEREED